MEQTPDLIELGQAVNRVIAGQALDRDQTRQVMTDILLDRGGSMNQGAFLAAVSAKGPTPGEMAGAWEAIYDVDTAKIRPGVDGPLIDNCGTGMDGFKTFNISTAAAIVAAAGNVLLARHGARAITSRCGTVDLCEALGVDVDADPQIVALSIEACGIGLFNGMSPGVHPKALFRVLSQINFGSLLNISASLANPARPVRGVRGVYAPELVRPVAETMRAIGYERALVFHGSTHPGANGDSGGMDELSPVGPSTAVEVMPDGSMRDFVIQPLELGMPQGLILDHIAGGIDPRQEAMRLLRIFSGQERGALYETICLNAAPIFFVAGKAADLKQGVRMARDLITGGRALDKLRQWVACQNRSPQKGRQRLEALLLQAELPA